MDDKRYAAAMELIASGLGAIGAAEIHRAYKDMAKLQKKTKNDGMLEAFVKDHPVPALRHKESRLTNPWPGSQQEKSTNWQVA